MIEHRHQCSHCGLPIGVYEPAVWLTDDGRTHAGSPLSVDIDRVGPGLSGVVHRECWDVRYGAERAPPE